MLFWLNNPGAGTVSLLCCKYLSHTPNMICNSRLHSRRDTQSLMNPAEIVVSKIQRQSRFEVLPLFRESTGKSGKPSHAHTHREILPLDIGRADLVEPGLALDWHWNGFNDLAWAVSFA